MLTPGKAVGAWGGYGCVSGSGLCVRRSEGAAPTVMRWLGCTGAGEPVWGLEWMYSLS